MAMTPEQREEVEKTIAANWAYQESLVTDRVPGRPEFKLALVQSEEDPALFSAEVQSELRASKSALESQDVEVYAAFMVMDAVGGGGGYVGEYVIPLAKIASLIITGVAGAWLKGKFGRKVRIEFFANGAIKKLQASSVEEVAAVIEMARAQGEPRPLKKPK